MGFLNWFKKADGKLRDVSVLAARLKMDVDALKKIRVEYREFQIPKRGKGMRRIQAPTPGLRRVQRLILFKILNPLKCHPAATGFEEGHSIVTNARPHVGKAVVVRMDIKDFFPSITSAKVKDFFGYMGWNKEAADLLTKLCTLDGVLPQGAPTSPRLSNLVNVKLDTRLEKLAHTIGAAYTRYADDMTFSFGKDEGSSVRALIHLTGIILREEGYRPHRRGKLHVRRRKDRQVVTGLVVNERIALPRKVRRWLRAVENCAGNGKAMSLTKEQLQGWRALVGMIERQTADDSGSGAQGSGAPSP